ncbi:MAG: chorismate synthase [Defluviitaleaceae bacterium]|nr:chorismate synthase [Defluviitaleaceae bacterium]
MSSTWKSNLSLTIFGQSHGEAIGMTLDGVPAGEEIDFARLDAFLLRRAPGNAPWTTPRKEADTPEFLAGLIGSEAGGKTCGAPIAAIIRNTNTRSADYDKKIPRPGHADFAAHVKYGGFADLSGGGHFSGRLTAPLCIAGGICLQILERRGVKIDAKILSVNGIADDYINEILRAKEAGDSVGGIIECVTTGLPGGLGSPMFDGMENRIAALAFAIPAVKGIEFGAGFAAAEMTGSQNNDPFVLRGDKIETATNHHGGILGGITSGMPLVFRVAIKPTPSISLPQQSVNLETLTPTTLEIKGRHDPCIVPRAVPCFEAVAAIAALDAMLQKRGTPCRYH